MPPSAGGKSVVSSTPLPSGRRDFPDFSLGELSGSARMDVIGSLGTLQTGIQPMRKIGGPTAGQGNHSGDDDKKKKCLNEGSYRMVKVPFHRHGAVHGDQRGDGGAAEGRKMGFPSIHQSQQGSPDQRSQRDVEHSSRLIKVSRHRGGNSGAAVVAGNGIVVSPDACPKPFPGVRLTFGAVDNPRRK